MRILILPAYFTPEKMASSHLDDNRYQAFSDNKIRMLCYTPQPTRGINKETYMKYSTIKYEVLYNHMMEVHRFCLMKESENTVQRALRYMLCAVKQFIKGISSKNVDAIYVVSTPPIQGAMGALIKKFKKVPLIYNLQDIFPDSLVGTGLASKNGFLWKIGRVIEDFTYRNADKIIVISEDFKRNIMAKGVPEEKIEVIYNWVDEKVVVNINRENNVLFDRYNLDPDKFYITYCGNIGLTQNMNLLLEVAQELSSINDIHFVVVGEGAYKKDVERLIDDKQIRNVTLLPFQPYEEISHVFSLGNIGLIISKPGVGENSVPSKTWSILSAERAVIANFDENELKSIIETNHCGIFTKAGDKDAFKNAILTLYNNKEDTIKMGRNGRQFILQSLTREIGTSKYVDVIKSFKKTNL